MSKATPKGLPASLNEAYQKVVEKYGGGGIITIKGKTLLFHKPTKTQRHNMGVDLLNATESTRQNIYRAVARDLVLSDQRADLSRMIEVTNSQPDDEKVSRRRIASDIINRLTNWFGGELPIEPVYSEKPTDDVSFRVGEVELAFQLPSEEQMEEFIKDTSRGQLYASSNRLTSQCVKDSSQLSKLIEVEGPMLIGRLAYILMEKYGETKGESGVSFTGF